MAITDADRAAIRDDLGDFGDEYADYVTTAWPPVEAEVRRRAGNGVPETVWRAACRQMILYGFRLAIDTPASRSVWRASGAAAMCAPFIVRRAPAVEAET